MPNYTEGIRWAVGEGFFYSLNVQLAGGASLSKRLLASVPLRILPCRSYVHRKCSISSLVPEINSPASRMSNLSHSAWSAGFRTPA